MKLDLSKNQLKELPDNFGDIAKLKHLDLYKNHLRHLPLSFHRLHALRWLDLKDNPLVPAIQKVAGPCFDTRQCQMCARKIVEFYGDMQSQVDAERQVREAQRQKSMELNALKAKQEKKKKKDKKQKAAKEPILNGGVADIAPESTDTPCNSDLLVEDISSTKPSSCVFKFTLFSTIALIISVLAVFVICSLKLPGSQVIEVFVADAWRNFFGKLPAGAQDYARKVENNVKMLQESVVSLGKFVVQALRHHYNLQFFVSEIIESVCNGANIVIDAVSSINVTSILQAR